MPAGRGIRRTLSATAFALAMLAATSAHADYKDSYARGVRAYEDGHFDEARTLIKQALDEHAEPAARLRLYGQVYKPYLPQHYLGMAAFRLGDCATALAQWNDPQNKGVLPIVPEAESEELQARPTCEAKLAAARPPPPPIPEPAKPAASELSKPVARSPPPIAKPVERPPEKAVVERPPPARNEPPQPLLQTFEDYLAGRYAEVARTDPDTYADPHARFHAYLVRAAARYTLSRIAGDEQALNGARADVRAARAIDARTQPDATLFSPAFRTFYGETR